MEYKKIEYLLSCREFIQNLYTIRKSTKNSKTAEVAEMHKHVDDLLELLINGKCDIE